MSRYALRSPANWRAVDLWSGIIAIALALLALWAWRSNSTASAACCSGVAVSAAAPATKAASLAGLGWTADGKLILTGSVKDDATRKSIVDSASARFGAANVVDRLAVNSMTSSQLLLTGSVTSEAEKAARAAWAASVYGPTVAVDNQLVVTAPRATTRPSVEKIYFLTANTELDQKGRDAVTRIVTHLKANPSAKAVISGFHDPRGNRAQNKLLAKDRAKSVRDELRAAGIDETRIEMRKPQETTGSGDLAEARRVELSVE